MHRDSDGSRAMKRISIALLAFLTTATWAQSGARSAEVERVQSATTVLSQIMEAPDKGIPDSIISGAKCIAIVPSNMKISFIFGANYGKGVATCRTAKGWSSPVFFRMTGGSFGFQAGGQASDLVLIIRTDDGMQHLLQSKFKLGADASASAGPVGRDTQAGTDLTMRAQVLTYSRSRGLFLGVSLSGAVIHQDDADTHAFYGQTWTFYSLLKGEVAAPKDAQGLLNTVEKYAPTPKVRAQVTPASAAAPTSSVTPAATATPTAAATPAPVGPPAAEPAATAAPAETPAPVSDAAPDTAPSATPAAPVSSSSSAHSSGGNH